VAGTIAALDQRDQAGQDDVAEALAYRLELTR
jgi:predicted ATPase with chaperone activity